MDSQKCSCLVAVEQRLEFKGWIIGLPECFRLDVSHGWLIPLSALVARIRDSNVRKSDGDCRKGQPSPCATKHNSEPDTGIVGWSIRTAIVNQLGPFLSPCPITARYNVIPAGYEKQICADLSRPSSVTMPTHACLPD